MPKNFGYNQIKSMLIKEQTLLSNMIAQEKEFLRLSPN
jgi:hypothetical protein